MKTNFKKTISLLLICAFLVLSFPAMAFSENTAELQGKKGSDFTENTYIAKQLQLLFEQLPYGEYPYFTVEGNVSCGNTLCTKCALGNVSTSHPVLKNNNLTFDVTAYSSDAFARYAFAMIFGTKIKSMNIFGNTVASSGLQTVGRVASNKTGISGSYEEMTLENLKAMLQKATPGDLLQARSSRGGKHTMMFLKADAATVTVFHAIDYTLGDIQKNKVAITEIPYEEMLSTWDHVISHLRAYDDVYKETWAKGDSAHTTHIYTDEGQNNCTVCGKTIDPLPQVTSAFAGVYRAKKNTVAYKGYYRSTGAVGAGISEGSFVETFGSVKNAAGKVFYVLENGSFVAEEDFEKRSAGVPVISIGSYPSGVLKKGNTFNLTGTVKDQGGLSYVKGYLLNNKGEVLQKDTARVYSNSYDIRTGVINQSLHFETLEEGEYVYLITASAKDGAMSSFMSEFTVAVSGNKPTPAAPKPPVAEVVTATTVHLQATEGYEYRIEGGRWTDSPVFTGLSPNKTYTFYQRIGETSKMNASPSSGALNIETGKTANTTVPPKPVLESVNSSSVTLKSTAGYEYSRDGTHWQTSPVFTGLASGKTYSFYQRIGETSKMNASVPSEVLYVTTKKGQSTEVPAPPSYVEITADRITLLHEDGYEYRREGTAWQKSNVFTGLSPNTTYVFFRRKAETGVSEAGKSSEGASITTRKKANTQMPANPDVYSVTENKIWLYDFEGYEYRIDGGAWTDHPIFTGLSPNTTYALTQRIKESGDTFASRESKTVYVTTEKRKVPAPSAPKLHSVQGMTVTLLQEPNREYSMDNGRSFRSSAVFQVSHYGTYQFLCRIKENQTDYASAVSDVLVVSVLPQKITSDQYNVDDLRGHISGISAGLTVKEFKNALFEGDYIQVKAPNGEVLSENDRLMTGAFIEMPSGEKKYTVIVKGDLNGDGKVSMSDIVLLKSYILDGAELSSAAFAAADLQNKGKPGMGDYVSIRNSILDGTKL